MLAGLLHPVPFGSWQKSTCGGFSAKGNPERCFAQTLFVLLPWGIPPIRRRICFQSAQFFQENSLLVFLERSVLVLHLAKAVLELDLGVLQQLLSLWGRQADVFAWPQQG